MLILWIYNILWYDYIYSIYIYIMSHAYICICYMYKYMHTYIIYLHTCIFHTWHHIYIHIIDKYEDIQYSRIRRSSWLEKPGSSCSTQTVLQGRSWAMGGAMMGGECAYDMYNYVFLHITLYLYDCMCIYCMHDYISLILDYEWMILAMKLTCNAWTVCIWNDIPWVHIWWVNTCKYCLYVRMGEDPTCLISDLCDHKSTLSQLT